MSTAETAPETSGTDPGGTDPGGTDPGGTGGRRPEARPATRGGGIAVVAERAALPVAWIVLIIIYTITSPDLFPTWSNISNILGSQAVLFVLALAALMPSF